MAQNEFMDGLKSTLKGEIDELESLKAAGVEALSELDEARASDDAGLVSEVSEKVERVGESIKAAQAKIEALQERMGWFKDYQIEDETKSTGGIDKDAMRELFNELKSGKVTPERSALTVGEHFANLLKYRGINSTRDIVDLKADTRLIVPLDNSPGAQEATKGATDIKSLYINHGVELLDVSENPVPGFMGAQCGLVEDRNVYCLLEPPADDFEECITQATLNGNRIRFTREVSRDNAAASVLETVYNPYPTFEQDGTKPEGIFTLATVEVNDSKIAQFVVASDEVLEDCSYVASLIDQFLISGVNQEKRRQLINGTGLNGEMRGILNQPDILTRTHRDAGDGGDVLDNYYDTFRRSLTDLWLQAASTENVCVIMHPRDGEIIDLTKDGFGRYLFNDSDCFNRMLRCLKIRYSVDVPQGTAIMGDFRNNWVFYTRKALEIRMGYTGDQFITNTNTILGEMRGLSLIRCPRKIVRVDGLGMGGDESPS